MLSLTPKSSVVPTHRLLLLFPLLTLLRLTGSAVAVAVAVAAAEKEYSYSSDLHRVLHKHGLPAGLFPRSVKSYNLDQTGRLEVHLDRPCLAQYETRVFFESVVRANLSFGQLKVLEGMSREELFLWLPVKDIIVTDPSSGLIVIDIALAFKRLSLSLFEDPPICRSHSGLMLKIGGRKGVGFTAQR